MSQAGVLFLRTPGCIWISLFGAHSCGQVLSLDTGVNPLKIMGSKRILNQIEVMFDGWKKEDPLTMKKLSIRADIPEYLGKIVANKDTDEGQKVIANLTLITFYYLLRVGEYTYELKRSDEK